MSLTSCDGVLVKKDSCLRVFVSSYILYESPPSDRRLPFPTLLPDPTRYTRDKEESLYPVLDPRNVISPTDVSFSFNPYSSGKEVLIIIYGRFGIIKLMSSIKPTFCRLNTLLAFLL